MGKFYLSMGNKDKYNQSDLTGIGNQNIREVKDQAKAAAFINEGSYINFNFAGFLQGFLNFFRPEDREAKVRSELLKGIKVEVVKRLEDSLQQNQLLVNQYLELPMFSQKEAVGRYERKKIISLPPETKIIDVFYRQDVAGKLLILGKPGAGKTTTLLRLAKELIEEAENNLDAPVPVIFELSNWQKDNLSIGNWLIQYLKDFYGMSDRRFSRSLLSQRKIMPLLDGLDELGLVRQRLCIEKINEFIGEDIRTCLVVCCRDEEYQEGNIRLEKLNGAYCLRSPEGEEIYRYLEGLGKVDLWEVIQNNSQMWELANIPLLLNIMVTVYQGEPIYDEEKLFAAYIDECLPYIDECLQRVRNKVEKREKLFYSEKQTRHWLTFLATRLEAENQTEFLIENIQPSWLKNNAQKLIYGLIFGLIYGLIFGLIVGLIGGLIVGLIGGLIVGLIVGLILGLIFKAGDIKCQEVFSFSWQAIKKSLIYGLIFGLIGVLILELIGGLILGLIFGLIGGLIGGLILGLNTDIKLKHTPNQGIKESLKNSLYISIITTPFFLLIPYLYTLATDNTFLQNSLIFSLYLGVIMGLSTGGVPCIQHFSLRLILWQNGLIPWNYEKFLKYVAQRKLIQQVGGRFRFIHDSLRQHFVGYNR
nr:NACHT domain-containing protein [Okeania sp. SIO3B5]